MLEYFMWIVDVWNTGGPRVNILAEISGLNNCVLIAWNCEGSVQCPGDAFQAYISAEKESNGHSTEHCKLQEQEKLIKLCSCFSLKHLHFSSFKFPKLW